MIVLTRAGAVPFVRTQILGDGWETRLRQRQQSAYPYRTNAEKI